jgi:hypothetical protein
MVASACATKLNRSHQVHGRNVLTLPCLGRTEKNIHQRERYVDDYDRIRGTLTKVFDGFEDFNHRRPRRAERTTVTNICSPKSAPPQRVWQPEQYFAALSAPASLPSGENAAAAQRESVSAVSIEVDWRSGVIDLCIAGRLAHGS